MSKILITGELNTSNEHSYIMRQQGEDGKFQRTRTPWSLDNFEDGYIDNKGRFRVWLSEHPRAYPSGYILRSIVAYEAYNGVTVPKGMNIHHIDENRTNDSKENLVMMTHAQHTRMTTNQKRPMETKERVCEYCKNVFIFQLSRLNDSTHKGRFCSQECWDGFRKGKNHPRYNRVITKCEWCGKRFEHIPSRKLRFCSNSCSAKHHWSAKKGGG